MMMQNTWQIGSMVGLLGLALTGCDDGVDRNQPEYRAKQCEVSELAPAGRLVEVRARCAFNPHAGIKEVDVMMSSDRARAQFGSSFIFSAEEVRELTRV
ncbi:MAG: hypothetical protein SFX74_01840, partial [Fimbriimonadaceae bacterium]|nr:hypothetical protein [Fimbriimonadaceae bacterium]